MPAHKGHKKAGGRTKGTPNKSTVELRDRLAEKYPDYDPVMAMVDLANDPSADPFMRFTASKEVAQYIHPKRKAIEHSGKDGEPLPTPVVQVLPPSADA